MKDTRTQFEDILRFRDMLPEGSVMTDAVLLAAVENFIGTDDRPDCSVR